MLQVGSLVDNKYKILSEVGHGGMSVVYLAINERANKTWAVKEIRKDGVCDFEAVKQGLVVETDMLKKLNHAHLPSIIDVIDTEDSFLIVMDYIEGQSLQSVLKKAGAQPQELVVEWAKQLADVLGYLHSREPAIIYRDMKPANVMLKPDGNITLIDFGTAREFKNRAMVEDTTCLGTRGYAAPEQFGGRGQTDARTDIYCLGATIYHLLTGHSPAEPPYEIKPLSYWDPRYAGSGLEQIINKCCQQDPAARYQSCAELMYDLEHVEEMNYSAKGSRRKKWYAFVGSVALFLTGVIGVVGFSLAKNNATSQTYDYYIEQAKQEISGGDFEGFVELVEDAVQIDPSRYDAYDLLLTQIESDGYMDKQTELGPLQRCLLSVSDGQNKTNENVLLDESPVDYAQVQFRIGKLLFLMSDGQDSDLSASVSYFDNALNKGDLGDDSEGRKNRALAEALATIGRHVSSLNSGTSVFLQSDYNYATLWEDLENLIEDNPIDSMGSNAYGIALYSRVASMILDKYKEFNNVGVDPDQMLDLLDRIAEALEQAKRSMTESEINRGLGTIVDNALKNVSSAQNQISTLKRGD